MNPISTLSKLVMAAVLAALCPAAAAKNLLKMPDFNQGEEIPAGANHDWTLGATGARGWIFCEKMVTSDARRIAITQVEKGPPSDGILAPSDVILGVGVYRDGLGKVLANQPAQVLPHKAIIAKLDEAGKTFKLLLIKMPLTHPYTSVFFQLECGYHLGEHGLWFKQSCFEESTRIPLIIAPPETKSAGKVCARTVELIDLYPTIADRAGLTPPKDLQGVSLRPLMEDPAAAWTRPAITQVQREGFPGHSVRTERWRYTEWDFGAKGAELYNHDTDPQELHNLASNPQHAETVMKMKGLLKTVHPAPVQGGRARTGFAESLGSRPNSS